MLFLGPGDHGILAGTPGQMDHPQIQAAMEQIASTTKAAGKRWVMQIFSHEHAKQVLELGGRFLRHGCDLLIVKAGLEEIQYEFGRLGITFDRRV